MDLTWVLAICSEGCSFSLGFQFLQNYLLASVGTKFQQCLPCVPGVHVFRLCKCNQGCSVSGVGKGNFEVQAVLWLQFMMGKKKTVRRETINFYHALCTQCTSPISEK